MQQFCAYAYYEYATIVFFLQWHRTMQANPSANLFLLAMSVCATYKYASAASNKHGLRYCWCYCFVVGRYLFLLDLLYFLLVIFSVISLQY